MSLNWWGRVRPGRCTMAARCDLSLPVLSRYFQAVPVLLICVLLLPVDAQNRSDEVQTLLQLKKHSNDLFFGGGYWNDWKESDANACAWAGVTCTDNYTVWALDFSGWADSLQSESMGIASLEILSNLRDLRQVHASSNHWVYVDVGNLTGLTHLDLSSNSLRSFPFHIENMTKLSHLDLSFNSITDPIPLCISSSRILQFLSLQQNSISGEIPSLASLEKLQFLNLSHNQLSGQFPKELGDLGTLLSVDLSNNSLNGTIPALPNVTDLLELKLDNNSFTNFVQPWVVVANSSLLRLTVSFNELGGAIPSSITDLRNLHYLNLSHNRLSGSIPFGFSKLNLTADLVVDLSQNLLVGNIPTDMLQWVGDPAMGGCQFFNSFNLSHNFLHGSIHLDVTKEYCFNVLDLSYNDFSGPVASSIMSTTYSLWLQNNRFSGDINDLLVQYLSGTFFPSDVRLQNNLFTGNLSGLINRTLVSLTNVDLSNNRLRWSTSSVIPDPIKATLDSLNHYGTLSQVRLGGNNFSGTSLSNLCLGNTSQLAVLDLSNSHLKGQMLGASFSASCLPSLQLLNISYNDISGAVPEEIFQLPSLQVLDMSNNSLSGRIPPIPPNSTLFSRQIFAGNVELCGFPLDPCPIALGAAGGVQWWVVLVIIAGSLTIALGSCFAAIWRFRVYQKRHQQDADLINALMERDSATLMPLREIKKATANFAKSAQIGEGGFGTVYIGKLNDGTIVAIKRSKGEGSDSDKEQFLNEVKILSQVNHRNLVKLLGCCLENKTAVLVFEFVSNGTLQEHLHGKIEAGHLSWKQRLNIAVQTASALNYLHTLTSSPIFHRDVKSANILLTDDLDAKVADFGISKLAPIQATHVFTRPDQGTLGYMDPEYFTSWRLTEKSDVYSFGVVLLELISGKPAIDFSRGGDDSSLVNFASSHIKREDLHGLIDPALTEIYSDPTGHGRESILKVGRLAMRCVNLRSKARPTMNKIWKELQHLWVELNGIREDWDDYEEDDDGAPRADHTILLSKHFFGDNSSSTIQSDSRGIELSQQSGPASFRTTSSGK